MRKIIAIACSLLLTISFATVAFSQKDNDKEPKIEGSGNVITKDVAIQPFDQLEAAIQKADPDRLQRKSIFQLHSARRSREGPAGPAPPRRSRG